MGAGAWGLIPALLFLSLVHGGHSQEHHPIDGQVLPAHVAERFRMLESKLDALTNSVSLLSSLLNSDTPREPEELLHVTEQTTMRMRPPSAAGSEHPVGTAASGGALGWGLWLLFVHEAWLFMQHANVLLNPYLQRLDRNYGIALLKRRLYWVIAGVLGAYWARETVSMALCFPHVTPLTQRLIGISCVYHTAKISLVSLDAYNRCSQCSTPWRIAKSLGSVHVVVAQLGRATSPK